MRYIYILTIFYLSSHLLIAQDIKNTSIKQDNVFNSKRLVEHYNEIRKAKSLPEITHDSLLDIVSNEVILNDKKYRKSINSFCEDSIRLLLYNKGVIDYKYELIEAEDKDTASAYSKFLVSDQSNNIRCGYARLNNKNYVLKTKSYLKYGYAESFIHSETIDFLSEKARASGAKIFTDSITYHVKGLNTGKYKFYYSENIPLTTDKLLNKIFFDVRTEKPTKLSGAWINYSDFDLAITSKYPDKYIIIRNEKNELIAVFK